MSKRTQFKRDKKRRIVNINNKLFTLVNTDLSFDGDNFDKDIPPKIKKLLGGKKTTFNPFGIDHDKLRRANG